MKRYLSYSWFCHSLSLSVSGNLQFYQSGPAVVLVQKIEKLQTFLQFVYDLYFYKEQNEHSRKMNWLLLTVHKDSTVSS